MRAKVLMLSNHGPYEAGQELTMSQEQANKFIDLGVAEEMELPEREVNTTTPPPPKPEPSEEEEETEEEPES